MISQMLSMDSKRPLTTLNTSAGKSIEQKQAEEIEQRHMEIVKKSGYTG